MQRSSLLFTHAYFLTLDPKQEQWHKPYPPLMTIQAAAIAREAGYEVRLHDVMFEAQPEKVATVISTVQPDTLVIYDDGFNYLTKMCLTNMRKAAWKMATVAKAKGCLVVACSSDATDHCEKYLANGVDYVLLGEGEETLLELLDALDEKDSIEGILGLAYLQGEKVVKTPRRPVMRDLDRLPMPAWDLIDFAAYRQRWESKWGYFSLNMATTRGCPFKCNWCAKPIYGDGYQMRSPAKVVEEIEFLQGLTSFDHLWFCDDIFGLKRSWVVAFADLIREKGLSIRYKIQSRADLLVKDQYIDALAASGCEEVWMGVESGSQKILDAMEKGITIGQVRVASEKLKSLGIKPCFFIQFGYLDETMEDIKKTIDLICELLPYDIGISVSYPLPGTKFFDRVKKDLTGKANWTDSDDLDLLFLNAFPAGFYKELHRYVHKKFRMKHAFAQLDRLQRAPASFHFAQLKRILSLFYYGPATYLAKYRLNAKYHEAKASL